MNAKQRQRIVMAVASVGASAMLVAGACSGDRRQSFWRSLDGGAAPTPEYRPSTSRANQGEARPATETSEPAPAGTQAEPR